MPASLMLYQYRYSWVEENYEGLILSCLLIVLVTISRWTEDRSSLFTLHLDVSQTMMWSLFFWKLGSIAWREWIGALNVNLVGLCITSSMNSLQVRTWCFVSGSSGRSPSCLISTSSQKMTRDSRHLVRLWDTLSTLVAVGCSYCKPPTPFDTRKRNNMSMIQVSANGGHQCQIAAVSSVIMILSLCNFAVFMKT